MNFKYNDNKCLCNNDYEEKIIYIDENNEEIKLGFNKQCITKMKSIDGGYDCLLVTGRTHQIRLTMLSFGTPIYGDSIYGSGQDLQLFAYYLAFRIF